MFQDRQVKWATSSPISKVLKHFDSMCQPNLNWNSETSEKRRRSKRGHEVPRGIALLLQQRSLKIGSKGTGCEQGLKRVAGEKTNAQIGAPSGMTSHVEVQVDVPSGGTASGRLKLKLKLKLGKKESGFAARKSYSHALIHADKESGHSFGAVEESRELYLGCSNRNVGRQINIATDLGTLTPSLCRCMHKKATEYFIDANLNYYSLLFSLRNYYGYVSDRFGQPPRKDPLYFGQPLDSVAWNNTVGQGQERKVARYQLVARGFEWKENLCAKSERNIINAYANHLLIMSYLQRKKKQIKFFCFMQSGSCSTRRQAATRDITRNSSRRALGSMQELSSYCAHHAFAHEYPIYVGLEHHAFARGDVWWEVEKAIQK